MRWVELMHEVMSAVVGLEIRATGSRRGVGTAAAALS
jgi:hypothetical protein